jgi:hypothetical protein
VREAEGRGACGYSAEKLRIDVPTGLHVRMGLKELRPYTYFVNRVLELSESIRHLVLVVSRACAAEGSG